MKTLTKWHHMAVAPESIITENSDGHESQEDNAEDVT
jgi:hypothetical protein